MEKPILNLHNKAEYEPAHTCEHILNQTMVRMFGCPRSKNAHIERRKSKCDCIGAHVKNTSEIGMFKIISHDFNDGVWRVRWKVTTVGN